MDWDDDSEGFDNYGAEDNEYNIDPVVYEAETKA